MKAKQIEKITPDPFSAFIEEIKNRNVLLMVGHAFEANTNVFKGDFYDYILRKLNILANTQGLDFSDLSCDNRFLLDIERPNHRRNLHEEIINIIDENEYSAEEDVSNDLLRLIKTGYFRFVFTTSFDPLVEIAMREKFGEVRVMNIYDKLNRDITSQSDLDIPTVYYLFGKAFFPKGNEVLKKFVATDNDALEILRKWQIDMGNSLLLRHASEKYLLTLGCTQSDWLFRFIWYTMKGGESGLSKGVISAFDKNECLSHYLKMNHILIDNNASELIDKILNAIKEDNEKIWDTPPIGSDVFISYSRADSTVADKLFKSLSAKGLKVWYDKKDLGGRHGGKFMDLIKTAIDTSTLFVAVLSDTISKQSQEVHIYRREWKWAEELKLGLTADCRCFVAFADSYDISGRKYLDDLGWLADTDNFEFKAETPNFDEWADVLQKKVSKINSNGRSNK